jgi:hypothetical protein
MRKRPGSVYDKWNISVVICRNKTYYVMVGHSTDLSKEHRRSTQRRASWLSTTEIKKVVM